MSYSRGFSLIEFMVVLTVIGIALAFGVPSFADALRKAELSSASNQLIATLQAARSEAIKRRATIRVQAGGEGSRRTWGQGWSIALVTTGAGGQEILTPLSRLDAPGKRLSFDALASGGNSRLTAIDFSREGELAGGIAGAEFTRIAGAEFTLCVEGQREGRRITQTRFGRTSTAATACS